MELFMPGFGIFGALAPGIPAFDPKRRRCGHDEWPYAGHLLEDRAPTPFQNHVTLLHALEHKLLPCKGLGWSLYAILL